MTDELSRDIRILIVDEQPILQNYLRFALETLGFLSFSHAENASAALALYQEKFFDLVICSFNLDGKDGYQLYQELKVRNLYRHSTGFIFISADTDPSLVHSVLELQPDEFMVKPFSIKDLKTRIERTMQRKQQLKPLYELLDQNKTVGAVQQIDHWLKQNSMPKFAPLLRKTRGEILINSNRWAEAEQFYDAILDRDPQPWAQLGLARCLMERGEFSQAIFLLQPLLRKSDYKLLALDLLSNIYLQQHLFDKAHAELKQAAALAPRNLLRQQKLLNLSRLNHDYEHQYKAARDLVKFARYSVFEQPDLYLNLARSCIDYALTTSEDDQTYRLSKVANETLNSMRKAFPDQPKEEQQLVLQARLLYLKDQIDKAKQLLLELQKAPQPDRLEDALDKAKALHEVGLLNASRQVLSQVTLDSQQEQGVDPVFIRYLQQEQKERAALPMGPREFNNNAVQMYEQGHWQTALDAFVQAFQVMPSNAGIALNLLQALRSGKAQLDAEQASLLEQQCELLLVNSKLTKEQQQRWLQLQGREPIAI
ncbi:MULTISPECIES: response regulator [Rheinheimera]|uniref:Response regulator n=1 Tax=Rheinheimera marina TaxID=1774958 RepID=A0ABV9JKR0_9GAMM